MGEVPEKRMPLTGTKAPAPPLNEATAALPLVLSS
jgi:hypothetical protein